MFALKRKIRRLENMRSLWERIEEIFNNDLSNLSDQCTAFSNLKDGIKIYLVRPCPRPLSIGHFINFDAIHQVVTKINGRVKIRSKAGDS